MDLTTIANRCFNNAYKHGFYEDIDRVMTRLKDKEDKEFVWKIWLSHRLMLIVSELAEGLEAIRDNNMSSKVKSGGLIEELIDSQIRTADLLQHIAPDKDIQGVLLDKMEYNESRPYKHGRSL